MTRRLALGHSNSCTVGKSIHTGIDGMYACRILGYPLKKRRRLVSRSTPRAEIHAWLAVLHFVMHNGDFQYDGALSVQHAYILACSYMLKQRICVGGVWIDAYVTAFGAV